MSKLSERAKEYGIPDTPYLPMGKNVLVFRLPNETKTAGGLWVPEAHAEPKPMGVLVAAGLAAMDVLAESLIEVGDIVWFGRFAGWEKEIERDPEGTGKQILSMKEGDVLGSVDALDRVSSYEMKRVESDSIPSMEHIYVKKGQKLRGVK